MYLITFIRRYRVILPTLIVLCLLFAHRNHFELSARGIHVWRQCNTLAVAKNFQQEGMNILQPKVDHRKGTNGITGAAFPFFEYVLALCYQTFGFSEGTHRYLQFFFSASLVFGGFYLGLSCFKAQLLPAFVTAWILAWSPELYYHGINALPDISAMAFAVWGLYAYLQFKQSQSSFWSILTVSFLALSGLIKLQFLMFSGVIVIDAFVNRAALKPFKIYFMSLFSAIPALIWYGYAVWLRSHTGLKDFGLFVNPSESISQSLSILKDNMVSDFPELLLGYGFIGLLLTGIFYFWKDGSKLLKIKVLLVLLGLVAFHILELDQMKYHGYYMMPYIVFMALGGGYGIFKLSSIELKRSKVWIVLILLLAMIQPILTTARINHRYEDQSETHLPSEFTNETQLLELRNALNQSHNVLIASDESGCVFFYFLQCKGWNDPGFEKMDFERLQSELAKTQAEKVVLYHTDIAETDLLKLGSMMQVGQFVIVELNR